MFFLSFSFLKPREEGRRDSAVLAYCQDSSLKTHHFPFISKIGPPAFYTIRMCNSYQEREALP